MILGGHFLPSKPLLIFDWLLATLNMGSTVCERNAVGSAQTWNLLLPIPILDYMYIQIHSTLRFALCINLNVIVSKLQMTIQRSLGSLLRRLGLMTDGGVYLGK